MKSKLFRGNIERECPYLWLLSGEIKMLAGKFVCEWAQKAQAASA